MHRVRFAVKNVEDEHPEHRLLTDRSADFSTFQAAMEFIRGIGASLRERREQLVGKPELEVA